MRYGLLWDLWDYGVAPFARLACIHLNWHTRYCRGTRYCRIGNPYGLIR